MTAEPDRQDRIAGIMRAVDQGSYEVPTDAVAEAVLRAWTMDDIVESFGRLQAGASDEAASDSASR